ncbi:hypothetical protein BCF59_0029 [Mycoplasmopsis mustelae]|uniref:Uncharacterized protein n=1 Tax=Mycoplasmopsis mustelae TaxID=171289 RepID=A0A4R7UEL4_9BACT|nr:hypothetical protein [Mycoplasmopsis mustelae]TDV24085.1 hypothetical protein BCF59_0029 [Mycoplasmopsis mustelae]
MNAAIAIANGYKTLHLNKLTYQSDYWKIQLIPHLVNNPNLDQYINDFFKTKIKIIISDVIKLEKFLGMY